MKRYKDVLLAAIIVAISLACHMVVAEMDRREAEEMQPDPAPIYEVVVISEPTLVVPTEPEPEPQPEATVVIPDINEPAYTEAELEALAIVIYQEAGGDACSDETRIMVGNVVMNRVADERFPNTIEEVLLAKQQYGRLYWTGLVWPERASQSIEVHAVQRAYDCAERVLNGERLLPDDVIWQAEFIQGTEIVAHQDGFYFCR